MSEDDSESAQPIAPEVDEATYKLTRELFQLARAGKAERLEALLKMGLAPNLRDGKGDSLLMIASYNGQHEKARLLIEHGADPHLGNGRGLIPLQGAAFKGDAETARLLLEHGADADAYEPAGYRRVPARLRSGREAWCT
jgi:ankyrin repeat protein